VPDENKESSPEWNERLLTPDDVAKWLGVSPRWVRDHAERRSPRIPAVDLGSFKRFRRIDIETFIKERTHFFPSGKLGT
jgi:hypothetical protein